MRSRPTARKELPYRTACKRAERAGEGVAAEGDRPCEPSDPLPGGTVLTRKSSFPPVVAKDARVLILGSLPGERSLAEQRYYAHPQNQFWRLLSPVVGTALETLDYEERLRALRTARIALWDVVASARRAGSRDAAIEGALANDLPPLVRSLPDLRAVAFNGGAAARIGQPLLAGTSPVLLTLPSSSPLHTIGVPAKQPTWSALGDYLA